MAKRAFDIIVSFVSLALLAFPLMACMLICARDTKASGLFSQLRIGRFGRTFTIYKLRTIRVDGEVSRVGNFFRKTKIDELPQLWNVLVGEMSLVGPRPDIAGYYDRLDGESRKILELRPGITSEASIKYRNEDSILALQPDPRAYNDEVIFPDKVRMNLDYYYKRSFWTDLAILAKTFFK